MIRQFRFWLVGALVGFANGFFGGGGGMICVPALRGVLRLPTKQAHATAIAVMLPVSVVSGFFYLTFGGLDFGVLFSASLGVLCGGAAGTVLLRKLRPGTVRTVFAALLAIAGLKLLIFG